MILVRRLCLLVAIMFWQGGFMFYGAVVVPVGAEILGSHQIQGFVTRSVTNYLNMAGIAALAFWIWDMSSDCNPIVVRRRLGWGLWLVLLLTLGLLGWLHLLMDHCLDVESMSILDEVRLRNLHSWYLGISTIQWGGSLLLVALSVLTWRSKDAAQPQPGRDLR